MAKVKAVSGPHGEFKNLKDNAMELGRPTLPRLWVSALQLEFSKLGFTADEMPR